MSPSYRGTTKPTQRQTKFQRTQNTYTQKDNNNNNNNNNHITITTRRTISTE
eukprot:m.111667 g.111667  ORF g.111667 m.111667 type:complete len:52 (-) comp12767_c3_seq4:451-606(-)